MYQLGHTAAFDALYSRHSTKVYGYILTRVSNRGVADDIYQAVFMKFHSSRHQYDSSRPFGPWLFSICHSVLMDSFRQAGRNPVEATDPALLEGLADVTGQTSDTGIDIESLEKLAEPQRLAINLRYRDGLSFEEIGRTLKISGTNARQLVSRGVRKLRSLLDQERRQK